MTRHSYKMTFLSEEGTPLFTMYNRNFDVLETRVIERMKTARIRKA